MPLDNLEEVEKFYREEIEELNKLWTKPVTNDRRWCPYRKHHNKYIECVNLISKNEIKIKNLEEEHSKNVEFYHKYKDNNDCYWHEVKFKGKRTTVGVELTILIPRLKFLPRKICNLEFEISLLQSELKKLWMYSDLDTFEAWRQDSYKKQLAELEERYIQYRIDATSPIDFL